jgi:protease I
MKGKKMNQQLKGMRVAILATDMVEEVELTKPRQALDDAGATTTLIAPESGEILSANHFDKGKSYPVDDTLENAKPEDFDAVLLPGGALNADKLRVNPQAQSFVQATTNAAKPLAVICHGPWLLIDSGLVKGKHLTSYHTIAEDLRNAGAEWSDEPVVVDGLFVSSRQPDDIPQFNDAMIKLFSESHKT